jgi:hypothetical protein
MSEEFSNIIKFQAYDLKYFADKLYSALGIPEELVSKDNESSCVKQDECLLVNPWDFLMDKHRRPCPCPFPEKLGVYVLKEGYISFGNFKRRHIRWDGYKFIFEDFSDIKGNILCITFNAGIHKPNMLNSWEHIEGGIDEYKNVELDEKYLKKKEPSVLFDPYYLGGRKDNLW